VGANRCALALVLACAGVLCALDVARAQEARGTLPGLNWVRLEGAEDCLSAAELAERVEQRVGRSLFAAPSEAEIFVDGAVRAVRGTRASAAPGGARAYEITLQVSRRSGEVLGERVLSIEGGACSAIDDAVSLVIAVTLYPDSSLLAAGIPLAPETAASLHALFGDEPTDPDPSSLPSPLHATTQAPTPVARAQRAEPPKRRAPEPPPFVLGLDAVALVGAGQLPGVRLAAGGSLRFAPRALFPIELGAMHYFASASRASGAAGTVELELTALRLAGCPWTLFAPQLRACVGVEVGVLSADPEGFAVTARASRDFVVNVELGALYRPQLLGGLHLRLGVFAGVPLAQRAFVYEAPDGAPQTLFRTAPLEGRAEFGLGFDF
jgi:hypothetical protein